MTRQRDDYGLWKTVAPPGFSVGGARFRLPGKDKMSHEVPQVPGRLTSANGETRYSNRSFALGAGSLVPGFLVAGCQNPMRCAFMGEIRITKSNFASVPGTRLSCIRAEGPSAIAWVDERSSEAQVARFPTLSCAEGASRFEACTIGLSLRLF